MRPTIHATSCVEQPTTPLQLRTLLTRCILFAAHLHAASERLLVQAHSPNKCSIARQMIMQTRPNAIAWNPMEPFHFTLASEDHCLYTFDLRKVPYLEVICSSAHNGSSHNGSFVPTKLYTVLKMKLTCLLCIYMISLSRFARFDTVRRVPYCPKLPI